MDILKLTIAAACLAAAGPAVAHVSVQPKTAPAGAYQALRFGVGHGCDGKATTRLVIRIPPEVATARPQPKPGWKLSMQRAAGRSDKVSAVIWTGRLPADQYDEFVMLVRLPAAGAPEPYLPRRADVRVRPGALGRVRTGPSGPSARARTHRGARHAPRSPLECPP